MVSVVPASAAAVSGTIALDKAFASPTGTVTVTVTDADLDTVTAANQTVSFTTVGAGGSQGFTLTLASGEEISGTPVVRKNDVNGTVVDESSNFVISVHNAATGTIFIQSFVDANGAEGDTDTTAAVAYSVVIDFNKAAKQTTTAKITSPSDGTGLSIVLTESTVSSGKFTSTFVVSASDTTNESGAGGNGAILAVAGQTITVKYTDADPSGTRTATVVVEGIKPGAEVISPANNAFVVDLSPDLTVNVTDADSAVKSTTIAFTIVSAMDDQGNSPTVTGASTVTTSAITNGYKASVTLGGFVSGRSYKVVWRATGSDKAGNTGQTDSAPDTAGNQDHTLIVDNKAPNFAGATVITGQWWDASKTTPAIETTATKALNTSIAVVLPDIISGVKEALDATTVSASDFEVDSLKKADGTTVNDVTPSAAVIHAKAANTILLTVPAMAADSKPTVKLKLGISDSAGNAVTTGTTSAATDGIAPTLTSSLSGSLHKTSITVTVNSDENLSSTPTVKANGVTQTVTLVGTNQWSSKITPGNGVWAVVISGTDTASNSRSLGDLISTASFPTSKSIVFYIDSAIPAPAVTPAGGSSTETADPFFINISFAAEGKEYGLNTDTDPDVMILATAGTVDKDLDVNGAVTITAATLDGVDVLSSLSTLDNSSFDLAVTGIATGAHKLLVSATDTAGNKITLNETKFTVVARKAYSVTMRAGWNLISLPGTPVDTSIDAVLPSTHPATQVLAFDQNNILGPWLIAKRAADGTWTGSLNTIDGRHGYWVNTTSAAPIKTLLKVPSAGTQVRLPTLGVSVGWNLLPVVDYTQQAFGTAITGYLTTVTWKVAYTYDTAQSNPWVRITAANLLETGRGYWVWATKAGHLVP